MRQAQVPVGREEPRRKQLGARGRDPCARLELPQYVAANGIVNAIIAMPGASHTARRRAVKVCTDAGMKVMTVPSYDDLVSGRVLMRAYFLGMSQQLRDFR